MRSTCLALVLFTLSLSLSSAASAAADHPTVAMHERHRSMLKTFCQKCHNAQRQEGKFNVDGLAFNIENIETAEQWQKVLNALNSGEMPPEDEKQLGLETKADFLDDLANVMVAARKSLGDQHGAITMRRLNRREYQGTLRELLGVEIDVSELPADVGNGSFDTVGSNLYMSSNQFEQYLALGRDALDEAWDRHAAQGSKHILRFEAEDTLTRIKTFYQDNLDALARAKQWIKAVDAAAARPENATIVAELRKDSKDDATFRRSWKQIAGAPAPEEFGFQTGENNADKANRAAGYENSFTRPYHEYYLRQPHLNTGAYLTIGVGNDLNSFLPLLIPFNWPVGDYVLRVRAAATSDAPPERRFLEFGVDPRHGQIVSTHEITGTIELPQVIEIPFTLTRKHNERANRTLFIREKGTNDHFTQTRARFDEAKRKNGLGPEVVIWVDWMEIERCSPADNSQPPGLAALSRLMDDKAQGLAEHELRSAIECFARESFRGVQPSKGYLDRLMTLYDARRQAGDKHSFALRETLSVALASPRFLYLAEPASDTTRRPLTGHELAVRLAYFLWGAPPDVRLRDLAIRGELAQPEVLTAETDRLLGDPRLVGFTRPFLYQWLGLDRLDFFEINRTLHPRFDESTKLAARQEVYETFEHLLKNDRSLSNLLKADYVVINSVLASYYGLAGVVGDEFRQTPLPPGSPRGGLLGMAAINAMGGNGEVTSPVERGAWVLRKLLNDPPPPAPANVPQIARLAGQLLTTRERFAAHREDAQCASCHRKIDPIGFGLENFDAVGLWRTEDSYQLTDETGRSNSKQIKTWKIDPSAAFHNGPAFRDYFEMREIIAAKSDPFARGVSQALVEYALGRPCGFSDERLIDSMVRRSPEKSLTLRHIIHALVASPEFHTK